MTYQEKRLQEFREKLKKITYRACLDNKQEEIVQEYTVAFLSETIDECRGFNNIERNFFHTVFLTDTEDVHNELIEHQQRGWNAHHDAVEAKFEGKEEK